MDKLTEIKTLKSLMNDETYLKDSVSIDTFEEMVLNIQNDHPIFLNTPHDAEQNAKLIAKVAELELSLKEKDETIGHLEQMVEKHSNRADDSIQQFERIAKKLVILTRVSRAAIDVDKLSPELRLELKAAYGTLHLPDDESDVILAKYWNSFPSPGWAERMELDKAAILGSCSVDRSR